MKLSFGFLLVFLSVLMAVLASAQCSYPHFVRSNFDTRLENSNNNTITNWSGNVVNNYGAPGYLPDPTYGMPERFRLVNEILSRNRLPTVSDSAVLNTSDYGKRLRELNERVLLLSERVLSLPAGSDRKRATAYLDGIKIDLGVATEITECVQPIVLVDSVSGLVSYFYLKSALDS